VLLLDELLALGGRWHNASAAIWHATQQLLMLRIPAVEL
jgi:hypothetical protein